MKKKLIITLIIALVISVLFAILMPRTSYIQVNQKKTATSSLSDIQQWDNSDIKQWDFKFNKALSTVTFYRDVWTGGERVLSEKITSTAAPERGTVLLEFASKRIKENPTTITYDMYVQIDEKKSSHRYGYSRIANELSHPGDFLAAMTTYLGVGMGKKVLLTPGENYILYLHVLNSTNGFSGAQIEAYDKWIEIFEEDKDSTFIVVRMETK